MKTFLAIVGGVAIFILSPIWTGFVFSILWGWFIVPIFHLASISIALAIGLGIAVRMITTTYEPQDKEKAQENLIRGMIFWFIYPLIALGMGAIVHVFV